MPKLIGGIIEERGEDGEEARHAECRKSIHPRNIKSRVVYDNAGRMTKTIEAYDDGDPSTGNADRDQLTAHGPDANDDGIPDSVTTSYDYDDNGSTIQVTTGSQITRYVYDLRNRLTGLDNNADGDTLDAVGQGQELPHGHRRQNRNVAIGVCLIKEPRLERGVSAIARREVRPLLTLVGAQPSFNAFHRPAHRSAPR